MHVTEMLTNTSLDKLPTSIEAFLAGSQKHETKSCEFFKNPLQRLLLAATKGGKRKREIEGMRERELRLGEKIGRDSEREREIKEKRGWCFCLGVLAPMSGSPTNYIANGPSPTPIGPAQSTKRERV